VKLKQELEYLEKTNKQLRVLIVPEGRERLLQNMSYLPNRDPGFNGQGKAAGVKHAICMSDVLAPKKRFSI
jgi:hypothetical protein